jgi:hypothetical protein
MSSKLHLNTGNKLGVDSTLGIGYVGPSISTAATAGDTVLFGNDAKINCMYFVLIQVQVRTHDHRGSSNHQSFYRDRFDMV